jgi:hypothetical protein
MGELVEHVEHPIPASIVGAVLHEVVGPVVIAVLWPQPDARSVRQPEPTALRLLMGNLEPLASPDTLDSLVVDEAAGLAQQPGRHGRAAPGVALSDAARAPHRRGARKHAAALAPARCRHGPNSRRYVITINVDMLSSEP